MQDRKNVARRDRLVKYQRKEKKKGNKWWFLKQELIKFLQFTQQRRQGILACVFACSSLTSGGIDPLKKPYYILIFCIATPSNVKRAHSRYQANTEIWQWWCECRCTDKICCEKMSPAQTGFQNIKCRSC